MLIGYKKIILKRKNLVSTGVHIGPLFVQPQTRNLNNNPKYEKLRHKVQIKWFSLFDDIIEVNYDKLQDK